MSSPLTNNKKQAIIFTDQQQQQQLPLLVSKKLSTSPYNLEVIIQYIDIHNKNNIIQDIQQDVLTNKIRKNALAIIIIAFESANQEGRGNLNSLQQLQTQYTNYIHDEFKTTVEIVYTCLPLLLQHAQPPFQPSTIILLGNRMCRSPNSPQQIMISAEKKALMGFAGSLFFEKRMQGLRVTCVHPGQVGQQQQQGLITYQDVADAMILPFHVGPISCIESIDLTTVVPRSLSIIKSSVKPVVFVSGGSRGIGASIAIACAKDLKMNVALVGRDDQALAKTKAAVAQHVGEDGVMTFCFDVRNNIAMKDALNETAKKFGHISVVVCSAGINRRRNAVSNDGKIFSDPVIWQDVININVNASMATAGYSLPHLLNNKTSIPSTIFFVGSRNIRVGGAPGQSTYIASKMAIAGFAQSLQQELKSHGVRVITLNVGLVGTELGTKPPTGGRTKEVFKPIPANLQISPEDVAQVCIYSLKDFAPHLSPTAIDVCGTQEEFVGKSDGGGLKLSQL
jgi:3-oxoacyl-[acyl-carrier protein] reductase